MNDQIIISVIVPLYKGSKYVKNIIIMCNRAFEKAQITNKAEIIFVNDYPEDIIVIDNKESFTRFICNKCNYGIHFSRVEGLKVARGKYIHFLDQDDEIDENFYLFLLEIGEKCDVIVGNGIIEHENGSKKIYSSKLEIESVKSAFYYVFFDNRIQSPGQALVRKESINELWCSNIMRTNCADDLFLWLLMLLEKRRFVVCNQMLYTHKYTGENASLNKDMERKSIEEMYHILCRYYEGGIIKLLNSKVRFIKGEKSGLFYVLMKIRMLRLRKKHIW